MVTEHYKGSSKTKKYCQISNFHSTLVAVQWRIKVQCTKIVMDKQPYQSWVTNQHFGDFLCHQH